MSLEAGPELRSKLQTLHVLTSAGLGFLVVFVISMSFVIAWTAYRSGQQSERLTRVSVETERKAEETRRALCAFRGDLQKRRDAAVEYLRNHPKGLPSLDLSASDLQRSIDGQTATLQSLGSLDCVGLLPS